MNKKIYTMPAIKRMTLKITSHILAGSIEKKDGDADAKDAGEYWNDSNNTDDQLRYSPWDE